MKSPELVLHPDQGEALSSEAMAMVQMILPSMTWYTLITGLAQTFAQFVNDESKHELYPRVLYKLSVLTYNNQNLSIACPNALLPYLVFHWCTMRMADLVWYAKIEEVHFVENANEDRVDRLTPIGIEFWENPLTRAHQQYREAIKLVWRFEGRCEKDRLLDAMDLFKNGNEIFGSTHSADDIKI